MFRAIYEVLITYTLEHEADQSREAETENIFHHRIQVRRLGKKTNIEKKTQKYRAS